MLRAIADAGAEWATTDGLIWLHLFKTVLAALLALGIAMLLELQQPRTAMTTVFVLMQPFSGMVLAKSFYRIVGTFVGMLAALLLGALFAQQPELYMLGITAWMGACVAAAVRYRHFRWYGFVLAGYTAALIGIPTVMEPNGLFLAALTRAAEVAIGIICSAAVSALIVPAFLHVRKYLQDRGKAAAGTNEALIQSADVIELIQSEFARDMAMCGKVDLKALDRSAVKIHRR